MASVAMMLGGAIANALVFSGSSFLFSSMSKGNIESERKRHDLAIERLQKAQVKWQRERQDRIDFINKKLMLEKKSEEKFSDLSIAMRRYHDVFGKKATLRELPREPRLSDFYTPSDNQHERELAFVAIGMIGVGVVLYYKT